MQSGSIPVIATPRLVLRPFTLADLQALKRVLDEPGIFQYFPNQLPWPEEKVRNYINYHQKHWYERGFGHWAVALRESGQLIGWNGLEFLFDTNETEVGYLLGRAHWGKGLATEAAQAAVNYGLDTAGLDQIIGLTHPENVASQRVLEKCGLAFSQRQTYFGMELFKYTVQARGI